MNVETLPAPASETAPAPIKATRNTRKPETAAPETRTPGMVASAHTAAALAAETRIGKAATAFAKSLRVAAKTRTPLPAAPDVSADYAAIDAALTGLRALCASNPASGIRLRGGKRTVGDVLTYFSKRETDAALRDAILADIA